MPKIVEEELTKLYYSIGEVAEMFEVNASLIRFWEKEFPTVKPKKNKKGNRLFSPKEIMKLQRIYGLVKEQGYTLDGAKKAMRSKEVPAVNNTENASNNQEVIERLESLRNRLLSMRR